MENKLSILEPIIVITTCVDGSHMKYEDYVYCGNGLLAYFNRDAYRYPKENNLYECFGKFSENYGPTYYIPRKYIDWEKTYKHNRIILTGYNSLNDFKVENVIDADTMETSHLNAEGYDWYEKLKQTAQRYLEIYNKN